METVYHYTTLDGLNAIENSGYIEESSVDVTDDAVFGQGVYLTTMSPAIGRKKIAENNYGTYLARRMEELGKVECCIRLHIPTEMLIRATYERDVWVHKGRIYLQNCAYQTIRWITERRPLSQILLMLFCPGSIRN